MFGTEDDLRLSEMRTQVDRMIEQVGSETPGFKESLSIFKRDLNKELSKILKRYDPRRVNAFASRLFVLDEAFQAIRDLTCRMASTSERVLALRDECSRGLDTSVADHLSTKCDAWVSSLELLLNGVERFQDLDAPQRILNVIDADVALYTDALSQLISSRSLAKELGPVVTAEMQAVFRNLQKTFTDGKLDDEWLKEAKERLAAFEPLSPPQALIDSQELLVIQHQWSKALRVQVRAELDFRVQEAVKALSQRKATGIEQLREDLRAEIAILNRDAAERREQCLAKLRDYSHCYSACVEKDGFLVKQLDELSAIKVESPTEFEHWEKKYDEVFGYFLKIAHDRSKDIFGYLFNQMQVLEERLASICRLDLSDEAEAEIYRLRSVLNRFGVISELIEALEALRQVKAGASASLDEAVGRLEKRSQSEWAEYRDDVDQFLMRLQSLERALLLKGVKNELSFSPSDLLPATGARATNIGLPALRKRLARAGEFLSRETQSFMFHWLDQAQIDLEFCRGAKTALAAVSPIEQDVPKAPSQVENPITAAELSLCARSLRQEFESRIEQGILETQSSLDQAHLKVDALLATPGYLTAEDEDGASSWLSDFSTHSELVFDSELVRFGAQVSLLNRYRSLFNRFEMDEREVHALVKKLRDRFQRFSGEGFRQFFPGFSQRVTELIYGVNTRSQQWAIAKTQLKEALQVLDSLETQALRITALEVSRGREALAKRIRRTTDAAERKELKDFADSLDGLPKYEFVPNALRHRLSEFSGDSEGRDSHA